MGAVQKLATVVIIGLTVLGTLLVFLLADETNRRDLEAVEQEEVAIERGIQTYITNCLVCHGPAGEGSTELLPNGEPARVGMPIGGNTPQRLINQSEDPVLRAEREGQIRNRIHGGSPIGCSTIYPSVPCAMPPWGEDFGGELNDEQIEELVLMIQNVDWNHVYNEAIKVSQGYPTPQVTAEASPEATAPGAPPTVTLTAYDIGWRYEDQPGPSVEMTVAPGTVIELVNSGAAHNFEVADLGISVDMPAGQTVGATIPADAPPGTYEFICNVPGHAAAGMRGTITVDPNWVPPGEGAGAAATQEGSPAAGTPEALPAATPPAAPPVASPEASPAATPAAAAPQEVTLEAYDIGWKVGDQPGPTVAFSIAAGGTITLVNTGAIAHNFTVDALGISVDPLPGETLTVTIPPETQPGDYEFFCAVPGHADAGMRGTLTIAAPTAVATPGGESAAQTVQLEAYDIGWRTSDQPDPQVTLTVAPGATIQLTNAGAAGHNFEVQALGIFVDLPPGANAQAMIPDDAPPGEYEFICNIPGHAAAGMRGTLIVR